MRAHKSHVENSISGFFAHHIGYVPAFLILNTEHALRHARFASVNSTLPERLMPAYESAREREKMSQYERGQFRRMADRECVDVRIATSI